MEAKNGVRELMGIHVVYGRQCAYECIFVIGRLYSRGCEKADRARAHCEVKRRIIFCDISHVSRFRRRDFRAYREQRVVSKAKYSERATYSLETLQARLFFLSVSRPALPGLL